MLVLLLTVGAWATFMAITKDKDTVEAEPTRQAEPTDVHENMGDSSGVPSASGSPTPTVASTTTPPQQVTQQPVATTPPQQVTSQPAATTTSAEPTPGPGQLYVPRLIGRIGAEADYLLRSVGLVPQHVGQRTNWAMCPVLTQNPPEGTIVDLDSTVTFATPPDDGTDC